MYGGFLATMALMNSDLTKRFGETMREIHNGGFARQFQAEREAGYPMLSMAEKMSLDDSPITQAEMRLRELLGK
jgi:ketol-acid reductoisomerase